MGTDAAIAAELRSIIDATLRGVLTEAQAERAVGLGADAARAVMLAASAHIAALHAKVSPGPHTPSGAIPAYAKPPSKRRRGKPGARHGHAGVRRSAPVTIDHVEEVAPRAVCPDCSGPVRPARRQRRRTVEDLPEDLRVEAVEYVIPRHWCPGCKRHLEPKVVVLTFIHRTLKLSGHDPRAAIDHALRAFSATGTLPPLPSAVAGGGRGAKI